MRFLIIHCDLNYPFYQNNAILVVISATQSCEQITINI